MTNLNATQVMELINSELEYAIEATENSFRNKCFVVLQGNQIQKFAKTKRSAESYIKNHSFSYYDEYFMEMREAGEGLYIVEVLALDIVDYFNTSSIWFTTLKNRWSRRQTNEYMLDKALQMGVSEEVLNTIKFVLAESDNNSFPSYEMVFGKPEQAEEVKNEVAATIEETPESVETVEETNNKTEATYKLNEEKNGIEIYFTDKPEEETRNLLKANGFRWSKYNKCWYAKQSEKTIQLAEQLSNSTVTTDNIDQEIEVVQFVDITTFNIPESTEKRLIDNSLINNNKYVGMYTKELQDTLTRLKNETEKVLNRTNDAYYQYKLVNAFNSFCKRYSEALNSYYYQSSINPSWAVTGRGNLNVDRYNKKMDQIHNKLGKTVEIVNSFESYLKKYDNKIKKDSKKRELELINNEIDNNTISLSFSTQKRKIEYYGYTYESRSYESPTYFFMKMAGCYRIFERETGKEVHSMKTNDNLNTTKRYVLYLESKKLDQAI